MWLWYMVKGSGCNNHAFNEFNTYMLHMNTKELLTANSPPFPTTTKHK